MSIYLSHSNCISYQNTIGEELQLTLLKEMEQPALIEPAYKDLLKPTLLRRMSKVLKMGNYCARAVLANDGEGVLNPDAIVVGTGLGCIKDTIGFLDEVLKNDEQTLAPTAFIQSTHNSIAGQIALMLQNYNYNMTIVQKSLSFEMALLDAELQLTAAGSKAVLVGAADELTESLVALLEKLSLATNTPLPMLGEGAAFFVATAQPAEQSIARVENISAFSNAVNAEDFLAKNEISPENYDLVLNGGVELSGSTIPQIYYKEYCGEYFTAPAFATHLALEIFRGKLQLPGLSLPSAPNRILILNTFDGHYGSIALEKFEI